MQSTANAEKYVAAHTAANECLARMGVRPPEGDAIYALLRGLPSSGLWPLVRKTIELEMQQNAQALQTYEATMGVGASLPFNTHIRGMNMAPPNTLSLRFSVTNPFLALMRSAVLVRPYIFQDAASTIISEATQMLQESGPPRPGSEYVNVAQSPRGDNINLETGLRKTKNNPSGTYCTPGCAPQKRCDHDTRHCYGVGGGMEGQAPCQKAKKENKEKQAVANSITPITATATETTNGCIPPPCTTPTTTNGIPTAGTVAAAISTPPTDHHFHKLSCVAVESLTPPEIVALSHAAITTILDSGATGYPIHDRSYFRSYVPDRSVQMKTLETEGHGDCVALLTLGDK